MLDETKVKQVFVEEAFSKVLFVYKQCSVTDQQELAKCMSLLKVEMDGLDVVINSVGILDEQNGKKTIDINYVRNESDRYSKNIDFYVFEIYLGRCCQLNSRCD